MHEILPWRLPRSVQWTWHATRLVIEKSTVLVYRGVLVGVLDTVC